MVSRRNFVAITIIMAIVLFLFQGLNVAREKLNYYDTNAYAKDKETLADGSGAFGAVDASDQINIEGSRGTIVYIGAEKSDSIGTVVQEWCRYMKYESAVYSSITKYEKAMEKKDTRLPEMVIVNSENIDWTTVKDTVELQKCTEQGILIGNWGEMHGSRYLTPDAFRTLTDTMIKAVDGACPVAVRKPAQWRELTLGWTEQEKKKLTLFNDGIFGSETDLGTYGTLSPETPGQKICSREEELEWQKNEMCGKFCGGEAIWGSGAEPAPFVSAPKAMADLERMHISYLNSTYDLRRLEQWKAETVEDESGLEAIGKRLGYRFVVEGVEFVSEREELQITLENKGFAELTEEADCYLELERNGTLQKKIQIATDARLWKSGEKTTLCQKIKLPAELAEPEEQKLYLALYRRRDGRTISFANQGEKQGRPFLGIFKIDPIVLI